MMTKMDEFETYLKNGKRLENLAKEKCEIKSKEVVANIHTMDYFKCFAKVVENVNGSGRMYFTPLISYAQKYRKNYEGLLNDLGRAKSLDEISTAKNNILETIDSSVCQHISSFEIIDEFSAADKKDIKMYHERVYFAKDKLNDTTLCKIIIDDTIFYGLTDRHKSNRFSFTQIYFGRDKKIIYNVMDLGVLLSCLHLIGQMQHMLFSGEVSPIVTDRLIELINDHRKACLQEELLRAYSRRIGKEEVIQKFDELIQLSAEYQIECSSKEIVQILKQSDNYNSILTDAKVQYFAVLLRSIVEQVIVWEQARVYERSLKSEYATVYKTKKTISVATKKAMMNSGFNNIFGFVELDDDCDIDKVEEIYKQFSVFKSMYFPNADCSKTSIRVRKLGQHKAYGLYYPSYDCICIDLRGQSSLLHEFGHWLDFSGNMLSGKREFMKIYYRYSEILRNLPDNTFPKNSRYSIDYYLTPTEVFARTMEMYFANEKNINSDIISDIENHPEYPQDDTLNMYIKDYFDVCINNS